MWFSLIQSNIKCQSTCCQPAQCTVCTAPILWRQNGSYHGPYAGCVDVVPASFYSHTPTHTHTHNYIHVASLRWMLQQASNYSGDAFLSQSLNPLMPSIHSHTSKCLHWFLCGSSILLIMCRYMFMNNDWQHWQNVLACWWRSI